MKEQKQLDGGQVGPGCTVVVNRRGHKVGSSGPHSLAAHLIWAFTGAPL